MTRRSFLLVVAGVTLSAIVGLVVRNQVKVYQGRRVRAALEQAERQRHAAELRRAALERQRRHALFEMLQPVALANCRLERFGEAHDGGYLMCANLLQGVGSGYSYGISGYDKWGCDISSRLKAPVHQYDCFNLSRPTCQTGRTIFHEECVDDTAQMVDGRTFDTIAHQLAKNGDDRRRIVLKIDVEGAEWDSLVATPDDTLERIDQLVVEFHWLQDERSNWVQDERYLRVVQRLKRFFEIGHIHYNNAGCVSGLDPFPTWAFEVLLVNKRLARVDRHRDAQLRHPLDAPNNPVLPDCQPNIH
jgi:hypothetical protein